MLEIEIKQTPILQELLFERKVDFSISTNSIEEKVKLLIIRDLFRLGWEMNFKANKLYIKPPESYDKQVIKDSMQIKRQELIAKNSNWINRHIKLAKENLADGENVWQSEIDPVIEVCETQKQFDLFRIFRFYWSAPYSEYVGRRLKVLIRDNALPSKPVIGLAALGSSIVHIPDRDRWVGWDTKSRTRNLIYTMDAYVIGAVPPYNELLGGKLICYILASNEIREKFSKKYKDQTTLIAKRQANDLACIFTTSIYGKSSQYNRIKFNENLLYIPVGQTKGYGTFHLTDETFNAMRELLDVNHVAVTNHFGDGPIWSMRVIRSAADLLGFDADFLLRHSFPRNIYTIPLARNFKEYLKGEDTELSYFDYPLSTLVDYWKTRWLNNRKKNMEIRDRVIQFHPENFTI